MSTHLYEIDAPGSELHGEPFTITDESRTRADERAAFHVRDTFALSTRRDVRAVHRASFPSRRAYEQWDGSGEAVPAAESEARAIADDRSDVADEIAFKQGRAS